MARRKNETTVSLSDEAVVAALMMYPTFKQAAENLQISERAIYERMHRREFMQLYESAKTDLLRAAAQQLNNKMSAAINVIDQIMKCDREDARTRLRAAEMLLDYSARFTERIAAGEQQAEQKTNSLYNFDI